MNDAENNIDSASNKHRSRAAGVILIGIIILLGLAPYPSPDEYAERLSAPAVQEQAAVISVTIDTDGVSDVARRQFHNVRNALTVLLEKIIETLEAGVSAIHIR